MSRSHCCDPDPQGALLRGLRRRLCAPGASPERSDLLFGLHAGLIAGVNKTYGKVLEASISLKTKD